MKIIFPFKTILMTLKCLYSIVLIFILLLKSLLCLSVIIAMLDSIRDFNNKYKMYENIKLYAIHLHLSTEYFPL